MKYLAQIPTLAIGTLFGILLCFVSISIVGCPAKETKTSVKKATEEETMPTQDEVIVEQLSTVSEGGYFPVQPSEDDLNVLTQAILETSNAAREVSDGELEIEQFRRQSDELNSLFLEKTGMSFGDFLQLELN